MKNYAVLGYNAATTLRIPNDRLECLQLLIELNTGATLKNYALLPSLMIASPRLGKSKNQYAKIRYDSKRKRGKLQQVQK
jgi:hypothetical protein